MRTFTLLSTLLPCVGACSSQPAGSGVDGGADSPDGPNILSLSANVDRLTESDPPLMISAVVTDPQGIDDVIGGQLVAPQGGTYATFATAAAEGAYGVTLTWEAIGQVAPIDEPAGGGERVFRAQFFDTAGHETTADLPITMACSWTSSALCAGECTYLPSDRYNCGACG
ncbi:MAG TPA: hypothetical protein VL172_14090, partial [Kofleriaceae bacterium]|nr:hypothetical protein [Kofleriaceae bacterium]